MTKKRKPYHYLSDFTDFLSMAIDSPTTDIIYAEDTFESGEFSAGFLFEMDKIKNDQGTFQPMGGIEILYDLSPDIDYKYTYAGSTEVNKDRISGMYSRRSLKTEVGFEMIYLNHNLPKIVLFSYQLYLEN